MNAFSDPPTRWYSLTPERSVIALLAAECLLWLSERFHWFGFSQYKGLTVAAAVGLVCLALLLMLLAFAVSWCFRRRFQFSIRSLLLLTLAVAMLCSWLAVRVKQAREQDAAVLALALAGARVEEDWTPRESFAFNPNNPFDAPEDYTFCTCVRERTRILLYHVFGTGFVSNVLEVANADGAARPPLQDADLKHLQSFPQLNCVSLAGSNITDGGLRELQGLERLRSLSLRWARITDAGLERVGRLTQIEQLDLSGTQVTNAGLGRLLGMGRLEQLELYDTLVDEDGVAQIQAALPNLTVKFSMSLSASDREAIRIAIRAEPKFRGLAIVQIEPAIGGGADATLAVPPHAFGPFLLMKRSGGAWRLVKEGVWSGEGEVHALPDEDSEIGP
jgi:hypothetical protein